MWKRPELELPASPTAPHESHQAADRSSPPASTSTLAAAIGPSVEIKGELTGSEDLTLDGRFEGQIELRQHALTVGPAARIKANISAREVIVLGQVIGDIVASEKVDLRAQGAIEGDIVSPAVAMVPGAQFRGSIDMQRPPKSAGA
jgi:cytoskeletal protein CcmA (bactofilin family)